MENPSFACRIFTAVVVLVAIQSVADYIVEKAVDTYLEKKEKRA